jgi:ABC-type Zn uptake system ZnuABC Zn-binding protein ZnuA
MNPRRLPLLLFVPAGVALALVVAGCTSSQPVWPEGKSARVLVTIPPLASFVQNVGRDQVAVKCLCAETGPHQRERDAQDDMALKDANLFFAIGLELDEKFADPLAEHAKKSALRYVKLGEALPENLKLKGEHDAHDEHDKDKKGKDAHGHEHGEYDPHIWLGIPQVKAMILTIRDELKTVDPAHAADYDGNAARYAKALDQLLADGKAQLAARKNKKIISFHESLAYFARSFGVEVADSIELGPGDEPAAGRLRDLAELCRKEHIRVIAVEPQYAQNTSAETLRRAVGTDMKLVEVDPLETAGDAHELESPKWYESKMRRNLEQLAKALP